MLPRSHHGRPSGKLREVACALYEQQDSAEKLAAFGLKPSDYERDSIEVWPDNHQSVGLFNRLSTQWRVGMSGCTGLDYGVMFQMMTRMGLSVEDFDRIEGDIRVLENEALSEMHRAQKET